MLPHFHGESPDAANAAGLGTTLGEPLQCVFTLFLDILHFLLSLESGHALQLLQVNYRHYSLSMLFSVFSFWPRFPRPSLKPVTSLDLWPFWPSFLRSTADLCTYIQIARGKSSSHIDCTPTNSSPNSSCKPAWKTWFASQLFRPSPWNISLQAEHFQVLSRKALQTLRTPFTKTSPHPSS